jgi:hypothetical protein
VGTFIEPTLLKLEKMMMMVMMQLLLRMRQRSSSNVLNDIVYGVERWWSGGGTNVVGRYLGVEAKWYGIIGQWRGCG